jgi:hypothetical protein
MDTHVVNKHFMEAAVGVGGLAAIGHFCAMIEPLLADLSYAAAIIVASVSIYFRLRGKP